MPPDGALRKNQKFKVQSLTPNVCLTPIGGIQTPVPYFCFEMGATANATAATVRFTNQEAFTLASHLQTTKNDAPGTAGGIVSGTFGSICEPIEGLAKIRACGKPVCRDRHLFWINAKNGIGLAYYDPVALGSYGGGVATEADSQNSKNGEVDSSSTSKDADPSKEGAENSNAPEKQTKYFKDENCEMSGGTSDMTSEEFESLETIDQENAKYANGKFLPWKDDIDCDDPGNPYSPHSPDGEANSCPFRHCRNNCLQTRHGYGGAAGARVGSDAVEGGQAIDAIMHGGYSDSTYSAGQTHDLQCSNPAGRELGSRADLAGESCERLCAIELGGFKYKHTGDGPPSAIYEAADTLKTAGESVKEAVESVKQTVESVKQTVEEISEAYERAKSIYERFSNPLIPMP